MRTGKDIDDDRLVRPQRAKARLVRVAGLVATSDDGMAGQSVCLDNGGVNNGPESFRGQRRIPKNQAAAFANSCGPECLHRRRHAAFGDGQRRTEFSDFVGGFLFPFGEKSARFGLHANSLALQSNGQPVREAVRHHHVPDAFLAQHPREDLINSWIFYPFATELVLVGAE